MATANMSGAWPQSIPLQFAVGIKDKGRSIKELVVSLMFLNLILGVFGQKRRDLATLSYPGLFELILIFSTNH